MGQFSWKCQDTGKRIVNGRPMRVVMRDDKNNKYVEDCYEGYGVFGGKDFYELVAEMNGYEISCSGSTPLVIHGPEGKFIGLYDKYEDAADKMRNIGIELAFDGHPHGDNPAIKYPSLTEQGWWCDGQCPESDPDQGFPMDEMYDEDEE